MTDDERRFYESVVHSLRSRGWSRAEAEDEALAKVERARVGSRTGQAPEVSRTG